MDWKRDILALVMKEPDKGLRTFYQACLGERQVPAVRLVLETQ